MLTAAAIGMAFYGLYSAAVGLVELVVTSRLEWWASLWLIGGGATLTIAAVDQTVPHEEIEDAVQRLRIDGLDGAGLGGRGLTTSEQDDGRDRHRDGQATPRSTVEPDGRGLENMGKLRNSWDV